MSETILAEHHSMPLRTWTFTIMFFVIIVQRIRSTVNEREQKQLLMDLDVVMRSNACPNIVKFYGALFKEVCFFNVVVYDSSHNMFFAM